jgi:3-oxoacyl-[acyl-carrier protein] reductase
LSEGAISGIAGRVALVTGGSRGIGADLCRRLGALGARVMVNGRNVDAVDAVVGAIGKAGGQAIAGVADCSDVNAVRRLRLATEKAFGPVDLLALFAGGGGEPKPFMESSLEEWNEAFALNLTTTFVVLREFLPGMIERQRGAIVTMASSAARQPAKSSAAYAAAKGAVITLTRHLAIEVAPSKVRINCIAPSAIVADRLAKAPEQVRSEIAASFPLRRLGEPKDVSEAALFLLSEASSWITGVTLDVAGGKVVG